jgi:GAF domain-containing protein
MTREATLTQTFVELADSLVTDFDVTDLLTLLAERCVAVLDVDAAGLMLADADGVLRVVASSSETMRVLELLELETAEGPCVDAFQTGRRSVNINLTSTGGRWPRFSEEAVRAGFHATDALPLRLRGDVIGALNLFRVRRGELDEADLQVAQAFADIATIAILQHRAAMEAGVLNEQLQRALDSRVVIEQAKGVVAEHLQLSMEDAFAALRGHARAKNLGLVALAQDVVAGVVSPSDLGAPRR